MQRVPGQRLVLMFPLLLLLGTPSLPAQEEAAADRQYREDYERYQKVMAIADPMRRADQLFTLIKERPDSRLVEYAQGNYLQILEGLLKTENFKPLMTLSERYIKLRPKVGETYYFYGAALRNANRYPEAMQALAKCYVIKNPASSKARAFLEFLYKSQNQGSVAGLNKIVQQAQNESK